MTDKFFPIETATACQLKWNWSTVYLHSATTASCHRTGWSKLSEQNFDQFHNTEKKLQERTSMLAGEWPTDSCNYCREIEQAGGFSDRQLHLKIPNLVPTELEQDSRAIVISPTILEVYLNNTCNLACLYCLPELSSRINQEHEKFGSFQSGTVHLTSSPKSKEYPAILEKFWNWLRNNSRGLRRFNVLGGEPFYQAEFTHLLDFFQQSDHPDLELGVVTNLMVTPAQLDAFLSRFKSLLVQRRLKRIDITCSIDCWGPEQEYVRYGIDLDVWEKNFNRLLDQKWLTININQTISVLTIKTIPQLLEKLSHWRSLRPVGHFFSMTSPGPSYLMPQIMGQGVFDRDFETILSLMPDTTDQDRMAISYMTGIRDTIVKCQPNAEEKRSLRLFLDEKDRRRGNNWRKTFPWLIGEIDHVV